MQMTEHRKILLANLARRQASNPAYSLRAFSRDIKLSPASTSLILSGQQGLSLKKAKEITEILGMTPKEKKVFLFSVESCHSRTQATKELATRKLALAQAHFEKQENEILKNWLALPILEYLRTHPQASLNELSEQFDIAKPQLKSLISILTSQKIISKKGRAWIVTTQYLKFGDETPSSIIRQYHKESLNRASRSIEEQSVEDRMLSTTIFNINPKQKAQAFEALTDFRKKFCVDFTSTADLNSESEVYSLAIQFFKTHRGSK